MPTLAITQHLHQNIKLEVTPSVKTCVNKILKESPRKRHEDQALGSWKRLEHQAPGDQLPQFILQMKRKFFFIQTLMEKIHQEVRRSFKEFEPQSEEEHKFLQSIVGQSLCKIWWISYQNSRFSQRCDFETIYERLLMGFISAYKESRRLQTNGDD